MRNLLMIAACIFMSLSLSAQQKDVTKFLGIPVDGTKSEMIAKLKAKGFKSSSYDREILEGEFNGKDVTVQIQTNNQKVSRIIVSDITGYDEAQIKIQWNNLCRQFAENSKYASLMEEFIIPEDERIGYEILVNKKEYQSCCFQKPLSPEGKVLELSDLPVEEYRQQFENKLVWFTIFAKYGEYRIIICYENKYNMANGEDL